LKLRILLFGHIGQIGWELLHRLGSLGETTGLSYPEIDFADTAAVRSRVRGQNPDLIINAAAYTAVDRAESDRAAAWAVNATAPGVLAEEARRLGIGLVHYSTDFVFDGSKREPYTEKDEPCPLNVYGRTKLEGDRAVQAVGGDYLILRTSWIYGLRGKNFLLSMRRLAEQGDRLRVVDDQVGCPTWAGAVARGTVEILTRLYGSRGSKTIREVSGLYNMACSGAVSWYGFAREFLPRSVDVEPIAADEYRSPARRPAYSVLDCSLLGDTFGVGLPPWRAALTECLSGNASDAV
jgi:dTDP-4-dehydrorhamnose reductase